MHPMVLQKFCLIFGQIQVTEFNLHKQMGIFLGGGGRKIRIIWWRASLGIFLFLIHVEVFWRPGNRQFMSGYLMSHFFFPDIPWWREKGEELSVWLVGFLHSMGGTAKGIECPFLFNHFLKVTLHVMQQMCPRFILLTFLYPKVMVVCSLDHLGDETFFDLQRLLSHKSCLECSNTSWQTVVIFIVLMKIW